MPLPTSQLSWKWVNTVTGVERRWTVNAALIRKHRHNESRLAFLYPERFLLPDGLTPLGRGSPSLPFLEGCTGVGFASNVSNGWVGASPPFG